MLNVDAFLVQRYPRFVSQHGKIARSLSRFLSLLFHTSRFEQFASDHPHLEGYDFVEAALRYFDFSLRVRTTERVRIPSTGRVVIAANHPIGSLDGLALLQLVREVRGDVKVVANDMLTTLDVLKPVLLPVNNMGGNTPRKNLRELKAHLEADGAVIIFPAGEVSRLGPKGIKDGTWQPGFIKIAKATKAPILPVFIGGRNSLIFYGISLIAKPLSTLWLVREMFKQRRCPRRQCGSLRGLLTVQCRDAASGRFVSQACLPLGARQAGHIQKYRDGCRTGEPHSAQGRNRAVRATRRYPGRQGNLPI